MKVITGEEVRIHLDPDSCREVVRRAMVALSDGAAVQPLREILAVPESPGLFGIMPGALGRVFGAKLASVFPPEWSGGHSHQGVLALFDRDAGGAPICIMPVGAVTGLRTAAASAAATDALARSDSNHLCVLGTGEQAWAHIVALVRVRRITRISVWGRSPEKARLLAARALQAFSIPTTAAPTVEAAVHGADIICTTTAAKEPILQRRWVANGAHLNIVGSSWAGPVEIDNELVAASRFFADHKTSVLHQGAEFLRAKAAGLVDDQHIVAEIGQVFAGKVEGRRQPGEITIYKSLGSIVQDLAAGWHVFEQSQAETFGTEVAFE